MTPTLKRNHYFNDNDIAEIRALYPGDWFDSLFERVVFHIHKLAEAAGELEEVQHHPRPVKIGATRRHNYRPDIKFRIVGEIEYCWTEAKGVGSRHWARNYKDWKDGAPGRLLIFSGSAFRPGISKVIVPQGGNSDGQEKTEGSTEQ